MEQHDYEPAPEASITPGTPPGSKHTHRIQTDRMTSHNTVLLRSRDKSAWQSLTSLANSYDTNWSTWRTMKEKNAHFAKLTKTPKVRLIEQESQNDLKRNDASKTLAVRREFGMERKASGTFFYGVD